MVHPYKRSTKRSSDTRTLDMVRLYTEETKTMAQIAEKHNCSVSQVFRILNMHGISGLKQIDPY